MNKYRTKIKAECELEVILTRDLQGNVEVEEVIDILDINDFEIKESDD